MPEVSDMELLRDYDRQGSEEAFAGLVRRHINLVYSVAFRHVGIAAHAEEITQAVFVILARKAAGLRPDTILEGWLHETTRLTALSFLRGERRRQFREQEAYMQSTLQESIDASAWNQLAPLLDEAMSRLGKTDRDAVMLRFFKDKSVREVAAALRVNEGAAQRRVLRAVEKLRRFFTKRGVVLPAAVLTAAISANSVQAAPVALAKSVTAVAVAKGAAAGGSTLALIKGALKIMAWTKAKTVAVTGLAVLLAAGTTTITVKEIHEHQTYPWQIHEGNITGDQLNQPPQVRILPSKFHIPDEYTGDKLLGTGVRAQDVVAAAYGFLTPARVILPAKLPEARYDFIACLPGGEDANKKALQKEVKRKFGVVGKTETRETDVWLLKVKTPNAPDLKLNKKDGDGGNGFYPDSGRFHGWNEAMLGVAAGLEYLANTPVIDETGLTNRFDFDLNCTETDLKNHDWDSVNLALGKLGLELVPTNRPIDMLVVEKVK